MDNETKNKIDNLERQVAELISWKNEKEKQQIKFPLDLESINILNKNFLSIVSDVSYQAGAGGNEFIFFIGKQGGTEVQLNPTLFIPYTVNPSTDYLTTQQTSGNIKFFNDSVVYLYTDGTPPTPLSALGLTQYYVINSDGYKFQLSTTLGGSAINITDIGSGRQFISS